MTVLWLPTSKRIIATPRNREAFCALSAEFTVSKAWPAFGEVCYLLDYFVATFLTRTLGFSTAIPLSLNPAITLFLFQIYRRIATRGSQASALGTPSASSSFIGAAFSSAVATWLLYPLMLAKTRLQTRRKQVREGDGADEELSMISIWEDALRKEGPHGLYQGIVAQLLKGFVSQGVTMMVKQR